MKKTLPPTVWTFAGKPKSRRGRKTRNTNATPATPTLWKLISRRPTWSMWTDSYFARDSHKKTPITAAVKSAKAAARAVAQQKKGARK